MITKIILPLAAALCVASQAQATLLSYDSFDYTAGTYSTLTNTASPSWYGDYISQNNDLEIVTGLSSGASPFATTGGAFTNSLAPAFDNWRMSMDSPITGTEVTTVYMSYLVQMDVNIANAFRVSIGDNQRLGAGIWNDGGTRKFMAEANSTRSFGSTVTIGTTYFLVAKMEFGNGTDTVSMSAFAPGDTVPGTEPVTWDVTQSANITNTQSVMRIDIYDNTAARAVVLDELRFGTTYDAVAVPEPSSFAWIVGASALAGVALRRRR